MASCADAYKPFDESTPATVGDVVFVGTLNRTALDGISEDDANSGTAPATFTVPDEFQLEIVDSKISAGIFGALQGIQLLSTSDAKVVKASGELPDTDSGTTYNESIELTLDDTANPTTATVIYRMGSSGAGYPTMSATYEGTLTKATSSGS